MSGRPKLLFVVPAMPSPTEHGTGMRGALFLEAFATDFDVSLLVVPVTGWMPSDTAREFVSTRTVATRVLPLAGHGDRAFDLITRMADPAERHAALMAYPKPQLLRFATPELLQEAADAFPGARFDVVHVMRLYLAPFAARFFEPRVRPGLLALDLDDDEPSVHERLSRLYALWGFASVAAVEAAEAAKYRALEIDCLPRFDRLSVCSRLDQEKIATRHRLESVQVVPNAVRMRPMPAARPAASGRRTILFIGGMGYAPNEDAALFLCRGVLPLIRARGGSDVDVVLVGSHPTPAVQALAQMGGVFVTGAVPDPLPYYAAADIAVVPIRAAGGTRIKLLEAFACGTPVVSTTMGAEGIDADSGEHLLLADDAPSFAAACLTLLRDPGAAREMARRARDLVSRLYAFDLVAARIRELYRR